MNPTAFYLTLWLVIPALIAELFASAIDNENGAEAAQDDEDGPFPMERMWH
jgi:hypothetical protein